RRKKNCKEKTVRKKRKSEEKKSEEKSGKNRQDLGRLSFILYLSSLLYRISEVQ
ncbi:unnamed protein product, partial [Brassica oleracea var. botrytis]